MFIRGGSKGRPSNHPFMFTSVKVLNESFNHFRFVLLRSESRNPRTGQDLISALRALQPLILIVYSDTKYDRSCGMTCSNDHKDYLCAIQISSFLLLQSQKLMRIIFSADHKSTFNRSAND